MRQIQGKLVLFRVSGEFELAGNSSYRGFELSGFNCKGKKNKKRQRKYKHNDKDKERQG